MLLQGPPNRRHNTSAFQVGIILVCVPVTVYSVRHVRRHVFFLRMSSTSVLARSLRSPYSMAVLGLCFLQQLL